MKKQILGIAAIAELLVSTTCSAQKVKGSQVPAGAIKRLMEKYPSATKVTWEKEKGNYEANWGGRSGEDMSVQFTPSGTFIEEVLAIPVSSLPVAISSYIKATYKGAKITEAGKVTNAAGKKMYEAEVKGKDLVFDEKGNFLKID